MIGIDRIDNDPSYSNRGLVADLVRWSIANHQRAVAAVRRRYWGT